MGEGKGMRLSGWLGEVSEGPRPESFEHLRSLVGLEWVREALQRTGTMTLRRRKLPNEAVVWLVIGMTLLRDRSIDMVLKHLGLAGYGATGGRCATGSPLSSAAVARARWRIGIEPILELFGLSAEQWVAECDGQNRWRGLRLYAFDGTTVRIPDTAANVEVYGRPGSSRSKAGYPQGRLVGLLAVGSRMLADLIIGTLAQGELTLAQMLVGNLPPDSLLLLDRGLIHYGMFARIIASHRDFLCRAKRGLRERVIRKLGPKDALVEIRLSSTHRRADPSLPETIIVRRIDYRIPGFRAARLFTSLLDPEVHSANEIVTLYHQRWEIELAYDEIKTHTLEREEAIRSKSPDLVLQELYGLAISYNVVRVMMARAALAAGVPPARMSFRNSLLEIRVFLLAAIHETPGALPRHYKRLCLQLALLVLPERRPRRYPRAVKIKMSSYPRKNSR